ncbi:DUF4148 domain-containing protein [Glaciimonas immobilis]|uniref:DUF4148 domain-containing protein n=1 Tax=Glaciimonas immobilis TaxID=728004 RepID=A0A840RUG6_9BURK|nr:DUF4148 domain-containing protein [Glaciimonas immobilis]KAF3997603.1 DUF4148 domain-containing protein [Glaciimonas immobilis]MBB5200698.1 hypothetical protein [Glaciimonas immobilis]
MNTKQLIAGLVVLVAAGSAFAVKPYPAEDHFVSTKTRADVTAELVSAEANGLMQESHASYPVLPSEKNPLTRAQVQQQVSEKSDTSVNTGN